MVDVELKAALHDELRWAREAMLWKLDGLSEYDIRRPLTATGTNFLGLIKHLSMGESKYLGEAFGRPYHEHLPWWDDDAQDNADKWATASERRSEIIERYQGVCEHSDATINLLNLDSPGHVPWWPRPNVKLINAIAHVLAETNRHAGHADILREQLDGATGFDPGDTSASQHDAAWWRGYVAAVEAAAQKAISIRSRSATADHPAAGGASAPVTPPTSEQSVLPTPRPVADVCPSSRLGEGFRTGQAAGSPPKPSGPGRAAAPRPTPAR